MVAGFLSLGYTRDRRQSERVRFPEKLTVVAFGDSTTARRPGVGLVYGELLEQMLGTMGVTTTVYIEGAGGNTTEDARGRFESGVLNHRPDVVVIQFGINDSSAPVWTDPPICDPPVPLARFRENIQFFASSARAQGAKVILMTPNPLRWSRTMLALYGRPPYEPGSPDGANVFLRKYVVALREFERAVDVDLVDVYGAYARHDFCDTLLLDGIHPNQEGHRLVSFLILRSLLRFFALSDGTAPEATAT